MSLWLPKDASLLQAGPGTGRAGSEDAAGVIAPTFRVYQIS